MNEKEAFRIKTQNIVQWNFPSDTELFENTFLNRGTIAQRWDGSKIDLKYTATFKKFESYWEKINKIFSDIPNAEVDKERYYWFVKHIIPNDLSYKHFTNDEKWEYFSNRKTLIPLRWSISDGDYYTPLVKRKSKLDNHFESLCPYCHMQGTNTSNWDHFFFNDDLFLSYQFHLWEEHWVSNKLSAEASPFVYQNIEGEAMISCTNCHQPFSAAKSLDLDEYRKHVEFCKITHCFDIEKIITNVSVKFSEYNHLIVYEQCGLFDIRQDAIFQGEQISGVLTEIKAYKKQLIAEKKELILEKIAERKLKRRGLQQSK